MVSPVPVVLVVPVVSPVPVALVVPVVSPVLVVLEAPVVSPVPVVVPVRRAGRPAHLSSATRSTTRARGPRR